MKEKPNYSHHSSRHVRYCMNGGSEGPPLRPTAVIQHRNEVAIEEVNSLTRPIRSASGRFLRYSVSPSYSIQS